MKYKLERFVEGDWYEWGTYDNIQSLVDAASYMGHAGYFGLTLRLTPIKDEAIT